MFLLWIADLDAPSEKRKSGMGHDGIPPAVIGNITGVVDSIYALEKRVGKDIAEVADKQEDFQKDVAELKERQNKILLGLGIAAVVAGAIVGAGVKMLGDHFFPAAPAAVNAPPPDTGAPPNGQPAGAGSNATAPADPPPGTGNAADAGGNDLG
ncbi:MAG: hypothetical protein M3Q08_16685 [Pseudomonadota bacterium]|nr:hypothetical protein [Pseudomonadota bacterium]